VEFRLADGDKAERGTEVTLFVGDEQKDFLEDYKLRQIIKKYCSFIPVDIYYENAAAEKKDDDPEPEPINDKSPLWLKKPTDCTDEEYKEFYREVFFDFNEPLFWMHLNMDYPFRLKGILYFPKLKHELESIEGQVKLYNNQVFIADNIKEVIPEFLLLLKGVIDCPDLPLNVSRSFLQNDGFVTKMSEYIIRKVADKLTTLFKNEREQYNKNWDDIAPFIKYGCIREKDFYDKVKTAVMYKLTDGTHVTADEYVAAFEPKIGKSVIYVTNEQQQAQYIKLITDQGIAAALLATRLDTPFINFIESQEKEIKFTRIDADLSEALVEGDGDNQNDKEALTAMFRDLLKREKLNVDVKALKSMGVPAVILLSEMSRRMKDMMAMYGSMGMPPATDGDDGETLVLNGSNPLIKRLVEIKDDEARRDDAEMICAQVYDLAVMSHKPLSTEGMNAFVERSALILERLI
jgi:molecular chaperone HtpG